MNSTQRLIVFALATGLFAWVFADALFGGGMFVFRDAAHFYYPLFQFTAEQWADGRVPLWNPYENLGQPLAGNPAASVFYPGKLIFAVPIGYAWAYKIYIMGHLVLAAATAYRLARRFDAGVIASGAAGISYAFSGNVLQQHCNVIFLVGAAWLPLALLAADGMLVRPKSNREHRPMRWAVALGAVLAMMVLGGDPQMAYNAGLLAAMYAVWLWVHESPEPVWKRVLGFLRRKQRVAGAKRSDAPVEHEPGASLRSATSHPKLLALAAVVGLALSAIQVLPSLEFANRSGRVGEYIGDRLAARAEPGTHAAYRYNFSVGPWRLAEYVWPNVGGRQYPAHRRWLEVIPAEGRIWTPSLYMGLLPLLLALATLRFRRCKSKDGSPGIEETRDRWLSWAVLLAVLASFGYYGLGWLAQEARLAMGQEPVLPGGMGAPLGGIYWLMTLVLPGYGSFRYPAKLLVVAALGLSILAVRGWDRVFAEPSPRFRRMLLWLGGISLVGVLAALVVRPYWDGWLAHVPPDMLFGPLDTAGAAADLLIAFLQTAVLCGAFWVLLRPTKSKRQWAQIAALVLLTVDLAVANRWLVACAPAGQWEKRSQLAQAMMQGREYGQLVRVSRPSLWPPRWKSAGSPTRMADGMRFDRETLWPKYHLAEGVALTQVYGTMMPADYEQFLSGLKKDSQPHPWAHYTILPGDLEDVSLRYNPGHLPRAWVVDRVDVLLPLESDDPASVRQRTHDVLYVDGELRDFRRQAVVETREKLPFGEAHVAENGTAVSFCRVVQSRPNKVEIDVQLTRPGLVVLADQFFPGWQLEVHPGTSVRDVPILRTNRVMRGVWLEAGRHRLVYRYRPTSFVWGIYISTVAWLGLAFWGRRAVYRRRRS